MKKIIQNLKIMKIYGWIAKLLRKRKSDSDFTLARAWAAVTPVTVCPYFNYLPQLARVL